jgi:hypothetical protein
MNLEVFDLAMKQIETYPETWRQSCWGYQAACGTSHCLAGWVVAQAGGQMVWWGAPDGDEGDSHVALVAEDVVMPGMGEPAIPIDLAALRLLDISVGDANALFHPHNTLDDLRAMGAELRENGRLSYAWHNPSRRSGEDVCPPGCELCDW